MINFIGQHQYRPSRFRNKRNEPPPGWRNAPYSLLTSLLRRVPLLQPEIPWLPIAAQRRIDAFLQANPGCTCLEYGSGMSTVWLAQRCGHVYSVEDSVWWYERVKQRLDSTGMTNVTYELRESQSDYIKFPVIGDRFDFVLVDGAWRSQTVRQALYHLKPNGWLYLDDTDRAVHDAGNSQSEQALRRYAQEMGGQVKYITDFVAHEFKVRQGALLMSSEKIAMQKKASMVRAIPNGSPIARLYLELQHLKHLYRQGWLRVGITPDQCESVAEHSFGVVTLAWLIAGQHYPHLDQMKVLEMALLHDLAEARVGDFTPGSITPDDKHRREREALAAMLAQLPDGAAYLNIWDEYEAGETPEAQLVYQIDRLEMALQAAVYQSKTELNLSEFFESSRARVTAPLLVDILNEAQRLAATGGNNEL